MLGHHNAPFTTIRNEGTLLPSDFLQRVAAYDPNLAGLTSTDYRRDNEKLNEVITNSWSHLLRKWTNFKTALTNTSINDKIATKLTQEQWLQEIFFELRYGSLSPAQPLEIDEKRYAVSHIWKQVPIHLTSFQAKLDDRREQVRARTGTLRYSPHSLVQDYINYVGKHPWGIASNGLRFRLIHKNMHMTRQAYLEFDLEAMMQGEIYTDFVLFWLLCDQSRLDNERREECWLEQWSHSAQKEGIRVLNRHATNVKDAIVALGKGFLACSTNKPLREKLRTGVLSDLDYYRQLLRLVYRFIVLFVAEDREVLFHPDSSDHIRQRYNDNYSTTRLRNLADLNPGTSHVDLFRGLQLIMERLGYPEGCPELGLSPLNGFLFSKKAIPDLETCDLANSDLLDAIRALAFTFNGKIRQRVNYKYIGSEELGSVYEGLLELHPILNIEGPTFELQQAKGNERKTTGSYYTPSSLVNCLLDSALEPIIQEALAETDAAKALLDLKICDPACGSGHFLIAAANRIAARLATVRAKDEEPTLREQRNALRDVVSHCIYGVDINPMAVELCKVSLWMESIEPGKPLSFLDHHILCGNSLIGTTPVLLREGIPDKAFEPINGDDKEVCNYYRKQNKKFREGNRTLFDPEGNVWESLSNVATNTSILEKISDDTVEGYHRKEDFYEQGKLSEDYQTSCLLADTWCAAFVWEKTSKFSYPITDEILRKIEHNPGDIKPWMKEEIDHLREQYHFFHWYLEFPTVFNRLEEGTKPENEQAGWNGGFDVVLGNPPWEHTEMKEQEWFASRNPEIALATGVERKNKIAALAINTPDMHKHFLRDRRHEEGQSHFTRASQRYPLCGHGRINTYTIFAETVLMLLSVYGKCGYIVPSGIATDDTTKDFFQFVSNSQRLESLYDFENKDEIFKSVHRSYKFCLFTINNGSRSTISKISDFVFFAHSTDDILTREHHFTLSADDLVLLNPNTGTCPTFRSERDAKLVKDIYRRMPILLKERPFEDNPWKITLRQGHFNMTSDSKLFHTRKQLESYDWILEGNTFYKEKEKCLPLYEGKMISHYDHRFNSYNNSLQSSELTYSEHKDASIYPIPKYWIPTSQLADIMKSNQSALLTFRRIVRSTDIRTSIFSIIPLVPCGDSLFIISSDIKNSTYLSFLASCFSSFILDYVTRQKINGTNLNFFIVKQLPVPSLESYLANCLWSNEISFGSWILPRVLELSYTTWDLEPFAKDCGYNGPPFIWDEERRFLLRCELDAAYFHLYGIKRDDVDHIMEAFPIVRKKDEKYFGNYRTKYVILSLYDAMDRAARSGKPYKTLLTPSPADPSVAHPPRD